MTALSVLTVALVLLPLFAIFAYLVYRHRLHQSRFPHQTPKPVGEPERHGQRHRRFDGHPRHCQSARRAPRIGAGIFLSEYGRNRYGDLVRFVSDVLNGVPSIVIGIVAYGLVVMRQKHFSALAGGVALAIMMIPTIARTTEQMLLLVPQAIREAAYGLGVSRWRTTLSITLRTATSASSPASCSPSPALPEKPLRFCSPPLATSTGTGSPISRRRFVATDFHYAISPFDEWHNKRGPVRWC